jgi:hypothetical protein
MKKLIDIIDTTNETNILQYCNFNQKPSKSHTMKTQINNLRSGNFNQILNPAIDYSQLPKSTSHTGHAGSTHEESNKVWDAVKSENPESMTINVMGIEITLAANWSLSRKSVSYSAAISVDDLSNVFGMIPAQNKQPFIVISDSTTIMVGNGKNERRFVCPSLIHIL